MRIENIANLETRLAQYRQERFDFYTQQLPMFLGIGLFVLGGLLFGLHYWTGNYANWQLHTVILAVCLTVPPALAVKPKRPTEADVLADQALRRFHGMDDTVEK